MTQKYKAAQLAVFSLYCGSIVWNMIKEDSFFRRNITDFGIIKYTPKACWFPTDLSL